FILRAGRLLILWRFITRLLIARFFFKRTLLVSGTGRYRLRYLLIFFLCFDLRRTIFFFRFWFIWCRFLFAFYRFVLYLWQAKGIIRFIKVTGTIFRLIIIGFVVFGHVRISLNMVNCTKLSYFFSRTNHASLTLILETPCY